MKFATRTEKARGSFHAAVLLATACVAAGVDAAITHDCDIVIYGSTPAALSAAVQAKRMGRSAVVVSPETRIGGLTTGGLGQTDIGNKAAFGGLALQFYKDVATYYGNPDHLIVQFPNEKRRKATSTGILKGESKWTFEPSVALSILEGWEKRDGLDIRRNEWLDREKGVEKKDGRIVSIKTLSGNVYRGKVFIDTTYEGDLMAAAGVSYHVGREANSVYGETLNGNEPSYAKYHQLHKGIDPYVVPGDPQSGLIPCVEPYDPNFKPGDGDKRVQAYCFRMCLTDNPANRIPFKKPEGYDEKDYELMFRHLALGPLDRNGMPWINSKMPNCKTDTNNRTGFSTDFIGQNWNWPEASYAEREKILAAHLKYQQGLMWTLANHPRVPAKIRKEVSRWGTCKDEFKDGLGDGWQKQLYVREARRMVGEYVMTEANCRGKIVAKRPIAMGAYTMDSHHVRRYVTAEGYVRNEGDVEVGTDDKGRRFPPYPIDYGAIVPKRAECANLFVPVCLSASHIAFGSIRMEPVFFALGQAAGTAASIAVADGVSVQDVPYAPLSARLRADGQVLEFVGTR
ncbi:MAG: FAD-dependent oxidoreductase [Kiritimatiellae bacterium]|nr:FAD-dependent oxidoreductase [Kiritimatiellia bacterium]